MRKNENIIDMEMNNEGVFEEVTKEGGLDKVIKKVKCDCIKELKEILGGPKNYQITINEDKKKDTFYSNRMYNKMLKLTNKLQGERIKKNESKNFRY